MVSCEYKLDEVNMKNKIFIQVGMQQQLQLPPDSEFMENEIQDVVGLLVGEYYPDKANFAKDHSLVKVLQEDLIKLGYNLGKTGADGKLGAKTKTAMHNFEQDFANYIKVGTDVQSKIKNLIATPKGNQR